MPSSNLLTERSDLRNAQRSATPITTHPLLHCLSVFNAPLAAAVTAVSPESLPPIDDVERDYKKPNGQNEGARKLQGSRANLPENRSSTSEALAEQRAKLLQATRSSQCQFPNPPRPASKSLFIDPPMRCRPELPPPKKIEEYTYLVSSPTDTQSPVGSSPVERPNPDSRGPVPVQCGANTRRGRQCKNRAYLLPTGDGPTVPGVLQAFCHVHGGRTKKDNTHVTSRQCCGMMQAGRQCRKTVKVRFSAPEDRGRAFCHLHREDQPAKSDSNSVRCSGITSKGQRCKNTKKASMPIDNSKSQVEYFCHYHKRDQGATTSSLRGFRSERTKEFVNFSDYIPGYLHSKTRAALEKEMAKPPSASDTPGYVYAFEVKDPKRPREVIIKIGRTSTSLQERLGEWQRKCSSKKTVLGWWPGRIWDKDFDDSRGCEFPGPKGMYTHKLERLIHLELADLVVYRTYLNPDFPVSSARQIKRSDTLGSMTLPFEKVKNRNDVCPDCEVTHKELFPFERSSNDPNREWNKIVVPVIERWGKFVTLFW